MLPKNERSSWRSPPRRTYMSTQGCHRYSTWTSVVFLSHKWFVKNWFACLWTTVCYTVQLDVIKITSTCKISTLKKWVDTWCMRYKATTCYILSVKKSPIYCHKLGNSVLEEVENNSYLGLSISNDLKWTNHIYNICKKVSSTLGLIRRNFDIVQL